tara:strand:+ start:401 stop:574 length:174 start_codon:yes stop_codon:yes gene_type:complete
MDTYWEDQVDFIDDEYQLQEFNKKRERPSPVLVSTRVQSTMGVMRELFSIFGEPYKL